VANLVKRIIVLSPVGKLFAKHMNNFGQPKHRGKSTCTNLTFIN